MIKVAFGIIRMKLFDFGSELGGNQFMELRKNGILSSDFSLVGNNQVVQVQSSIKETNQHALLTISILEGPQKSKSIREKDLLLFID